jgi:hypothetical protein
LAYILRTQESETGGRKIIKKNNTVAASLLRLPQPLKHQNHKPLSPSKPNTVANLQIRITTQKSTQNHQSRIEIETQIKTVTNQNHSIPTNPQPSEPTHRQYTRTPTHNTHTLRIENKNKRKKKKHIETEKRKKETGTKYHTTAVDPIWPLGKDSGDLGFRFGFRRRNSIGLVLKFLDFGEVWLEKTAVPPSVAVPSFSGEREIRKSERAGTS